MAQNYCPTFVFIPSFDRKRKILFFFSNMFLRSLPVCDSLFAHQPTFYHQTFRLKRFILWFVVDVFTIDNRLYYTYFNIHVLKLTPCFSIQFTSKWCRWNGKQWRPRSDCSKSNLILVCSVCLNYLSNFITSTVKITV